MLEDSNKMPVTSPSPALHMALHTLQYHSLSRNTLLQLCIRISKVKENRDPKEMVKKKMLAISRLHFLEYCKN